MDFLLVNVRNFSEKFFLLLFDLIDELILVKDLASGLTQFHSIFTTRQQNFIKDHYFILPISLKLVSKLSRKFFLRILFN